MLPSSDLKASAPRIIVFPVLNSPAHPYRYRRFACPLAGTDARLAGKRGLVTPSFQGTCTPCLLPVRLAHQIRTCALTHTAPTFGSDRGPRGHAVSVRPPVSRFLGSVSDPCFGLADSRRSPALAPATPQRLVTALFAAFIATMPVSDFFAPYIIGLRHHAFPMRSYRLPDRTTRRPPRFRRGVYVRAWGLRRRDVRLRLAIAAHPILPSTMRRASAHSEHISFGAQYPAHTRRYRRFTDTLTGIAARLAVNRGSAHPSFQGLSPLPLRQLAWRTLILIVAPQASTVPAAIAGPNRIQVQLLRGRLRGASSCICVPEIRPRSR